MLGELQASSQPCEKMFASLLEAENRISAKDKAKSPILRNKVNTITEKIRIEQEAKAFLLAKISELQTLLTESNQCRQNKQRDFCNFTKIELRSLMTSNGPAKEIIQELINRAIAKGALERASSLKHEDLMKLIHEHPDLYADFENTAKEFVTNCQLLCKDSYMAALRDVEKDNKIWLKSLEVKASKAKTATEFRKIVEQMGPSPAAKALAQPYECPIPEIPRDLVGAIKNTRDTAENAKENLVRASKKRKIGDTMDEACHKILGI